MDVCSVCARRGQVLGPACVPGQGMQGPLDSPLLPANETHTHSHMQRLRGASIRARMRAAARPVSPPLRNERLRARRPPPTNRHTNTYMQISHLNSAAGKGLSAASHTEQGGLSDSPWQQQMINSTADDRRFSMATPEPMRSHHPESLETYI